MNDNRVSYSEQRSVNIGDYESISMNLSISADVKLQEVNGEIILPLFEKQTASLDTGKNLKDQINLLISNVRQVLDVEELNIRKATRDFANFSTMKKTPKKRRRILDEAN